MGQGTNNNCIEMSYSRPKSDRSLARIFSSVK